MVDTFFLSKIFKKINLQKKFIFGKIAVGKEQPATLIKKIPSHVPFTARLTQKIVKFCRSLKIHDNVLLSRVSNEWEHDSLFSSKVKPVNKIHAQGCQKILARQKLNFKQQSTRTTSTTSILSYKVTHFLVFVVAKIRFFSREETYMLWTQPVFTCSKWIMNTEWLKKLWSMFTVNSKNTRTKPVEVVAVSFGVN